MKNRRKAREYMLKALYQFDIGKDNNLDACLEDVFQVHEYNDEIKEYALRLLRTIKDNFDEITSTIKKFSKNWKLERMAVIDRNILRIAIAEMLYMDDIPEKVSINEAVEISKKYSTDESYAFINGILHRLYVNLQENQNNVKL